MCTECPAGYTCNGTDKTQCAATKYVKDNTCTACPAGFKCENGIKLSCEAGEFASGSSATCAKKKQSCPDKDGKPQFLNIIKGTTKDNDCRPCSAEYKCFGTNARKFANTARTKAGEWAPCRKGDYINVKNANKPTCDICPDGFECKDGITAVDLVGGGGGGGGGSGLGVGAWVGIAAAVGAVVGAIVAYRRHGNKTSGNAGMSRAITSSRKSVSAGDGGRADTG